MPLSKKSGNGATAEAPVVTPPPTTAAVGEATTQVTAPKAAPKQSAPKTANKEDNTMSKADWQKKDERISRQGLFQAALQSMAGLQFNSGGTIESYLAVVTKIADHGLEYVNKTSTRDA